MNPIGPGKCWTIFRSSKGYVKPSSGEKIVLWRKGQKCRWMTQDGSLVGHEQSDVAPALAWAEANGYKIAW